MQQVVSRVEPMSANTLHEREKALRQFLEGCENVNHRVVAFETNVVAKGGFIRTQSYTLEILAVIEG